MNFVVVVGEFVLVDVFFVPGIFIFFFFLLFFSERKHCFAQDLTVLNMK